MGHRTGFSYCQLSWSPVFKLSTNYTFKNRVVHISGFKFWIVHKSGSGFLKVSLTWGTLYSERGGKEFVKIAVFEQENRLILPKSCQ